jgi:hypothetical protein
MAAGEPSEKDPVLLEIVERLKRHLDPERIYLFGSRARGESGADSDYDLPVIVGSSDLPRYKRNQEAFRLLRGIGASKDVIVLTRDEFGEKRQVASSLAATVEREGCILYE